MLRQSIGDLVPGRFGTDEDVHRRPDGRFVQERAHRHMYVRPLPHDREEKGAAVSAVHVVNGSLVAVDQEAVAAFVQAKV